ncbi:MAG: PGPGW domain-containing protein [Planctomycetota bacterium]|jgi:hypothetical protein
MLEWIRAHETAIWWLAAISAVTFVGTLIVVPILVVRIPPEYFVDERHRPRTWGRVRHPVLRLVAVVSKNALGCVFIAAGLAMLFLPGQGVITILIGIMLTDFPGKYRFERWIVMRAPVTRAINWLRRRSHRPALRLGPEPR